MPPVLPPLQSLQKNTLQTSQQVKINTDEEITQYWKMVAKKVVSQNKAVFTKMTIKGETARLESIWISNFCPNITCSQRSSSLWCTLKTHIVKHKCNPFNSSSHLWGSVDVSVCKQHLNPEPLRQQSESWQGSLLSDSPSRKHPVFERS